MSLILSKVSGLEGQVELVGLRAVVATFLRWSIERRGESRSVDPSWTLRGVFSYQKDSILTNPAMTKRIKIKFPNGGWYECVLDYGVSIKIEGDRITVEGVKLWPVGQSPK